MKRNTGILLWVICALFGSLLSTSAQASTEKFLKLRADDVTNEAAIMQTDLPAPLNSVFAYFGTQDGGTDAEKWQFKIILGDRSSGTLEVPVEALLPATTYYFSFQGRSADGESWASAAKFTTAPETAMQDSSAYLKHLARNEIPARGFIGSKPALRWEEGLISGNGKMGALAFSRPLEEKIIFTHEKLYLPFDNPLPPIEMAPLLPQIRKLILEGKYDEAAAIPVAESKKEGYGLAWVRWTDGFLPAFDLQIHMAPKGTIRDYVRSEDFSTGVAAVRWTDDRGNFSRRYFVSRADNVVVLSLKGPQQGSLSCELELAQRPIDKTNDGAAQEHFAYGIKQIEIGATQGWLTYRSSFARSDGGYQGVARVVVHGGSSRLNGRKLIVTDADEVLVLGRVETTKDYAKSSLPALQKEVEKVAPDFQTLLDRHVKIHGAIFNRVKLDLNGGDDRYLPIEELQAKSRTQTSPALLEKVFDAGRYTILSATGDWPPNLQGRWAGSWSAPWSGDYTLDGNAQVAVNSLLNGNMPELIPSFLNYFEGMMPAFRENARRMYGARGILLPPRASTHGFHNHFNKEYPLTYWTAGAGWISHYFFDYYLYTGDRKFLAEHAVPFMKETALFYEDFLQQGPDGKYVFNPSYSPENTPRNSNSQAAINATMDIAIARELLTNLISACETLKIEQNSVPRWKQMLVKLPDYAINSDGALKEWIWPTLEDQYGHRHLSHLYALFHGVSPDVANNPALLAAFRRAAERRIEWRKQQDGGDMAFGMVQLGDVADSLGDGNSAYSILTGLANHYYYGNLMSAHNPGPALFNADISGGLPDTVIRMLVQSQPGRLELLPALPQQLPSGEIGGVLAQGQIVVKKLKWDGHLCQVVLNSRIEQKVTISLPREIASILAGAGGTVDSSQGKERVVSLPANSDVELSIVLK